MGKSFEYSPFYRFLWYIGIVLGVIFFIAAIYALLTESLSFRSSVWVLGIFLGIGITAGSIVELSNYQTIFVDENGISTLGPNRKVFVSWSNIDKLFYTQGEGLAAHEAFYSFYIKSKNGEIIKISQDIKNFHELGTIVLERCPTGRAEYIPFFDLARLYYRSYFKKPVTYHHQS